MNALDQQVTPEQVEAGQAVYSSRTLRMYDWVVLGISNRLIWRCPTSHILELTNTHITGNHLDVGVGSGFYLDRCQFPTESPRLGLLDLNQEALQFASQRLRRFSPETYQCNVLEPILFSGAKFDSISIHYVLHCLPGQLPFKCVALDHLIKLMNPGGVLFGSTLLRREINAGPCARPLMAFYNRKGIFSNEHDGLSVLREQLDSRFQEVQIQTRGCCALFHARMPTC